MYNIAICDDERIVQEQLMLYLNHVEEECGQSFSIQCFSSGEQLLAELDPDTQILLLDIGLSNLNGLDVARQLRKQGRDLCIIFITTMGECALQGYEVHAFGFLVKPLEYGRFARQMKEALGVIRQTMGMRVTLRRQDQVAVYNTLDILYFEVMRHCLKVVTSSERQEFNIPLRDMEAQLEGQGFLRCHKSFLVNCRHVSKIGTTSLVMDNGDEIALSKHRRSSFLVDFHRCIRGDLS